jgi:type VI protein secretion system component VasK
MAVFQFVFSWRVIWLILIVGVYFMICWFAEIWFVSAKFIPGRQDDLLLFLDGRFSRACFYIAVPMYLAADDCLLARKDKIIEGESSVSRALMKEMDEKHEHYERRLKEMEGQLARLEMNTKKTL